MMAQNVLRSTSRSTSQTALIVVLPMRNVRYRFRLWMKLLLPFTWALAGASFDVSFTMRLLSQLCGFLEEGPHDGQIAKLGRDECRGGAHQQNEDDGEENGDPDFAPG